MGVAMHDTTNLVENGPIITFELHLMSHINLPHNKLDPSYLGPFTIGLIDGDDSIQVHHWRSKILYIIVVKIANRAFNVNIGSEDPAGRGSCVLDQGDSSGREEGEEDGGEGPQILQESSRQRASIARVETE